MRIFFFFSILLVFIANHADAQFTSAYETRGLMDLYNSNKLIDGAWRNVVTEDQIQGSPYLSEEFAEGTIYTTQRIKYDSILLRYHIFNDELQFKNPEGEVLAIAQPETIEKAVFNNIELVNLPYTFGGKTKNGFFILVEQGKAWFLVKPQVGFQEATLPAAYKEAEPARFISKSDEYYLRIENNAAVTVNNKKDLIAAFPDNQDKIESFISKNKIKTNKKEGIAEVVRYYNSL